RRVLFRSEANGWDGVLLWDHVQFLEGTRTLDPWVTLGAMAQVTERVLLGTLVTPLSRRRPYVVAKQLVTLDHLSGGRAVLGVGLGEPTDRDFADLGEESDRKVRRHARRVARGHRRTAAGAGVALR